MSEMNHNGRRMPENNKSPRKLDELREVLRTISSKEIQKSSKSTQGDEQQKNITARGEVHKDTAQKDTNGPSLRDALASILPAQEAAEPQEVARPVPPPVQKVEQKTEQPFPEVHEYAEKKNIDDPLSPKRLERMMRVTSSDKSPLL